MRHISSSASVSRPKKMGAWRRSNGRGPTYGAARAPGMTRKRAVSVVMGELLPAAPQFDQELTRRAPVDVNVHPPVELPVERPDHLQLLVRGSGVPRVLRHLEAQ